MEPSYSVAGCMNILSQAVDCLCMQGRQYRADRKCSDCSVCKEAATEHVPCFCKYVGSSHSALPPPRKAASNRLTMGSSSDPKMVGLAQPKAFVSGPRKVIGSVRSRLISWSVKLSNSCLQHAQSVVRSIWDAIMLMPDMPLRKPHQKPIKYTKGKTAPKSDKKPMRMLKEATHS